MDATLIPILLFELFDHPAGLVGRNAKDDLSGALAQSFGRIIDQKVTLIQNRNPIAFLCFLEKVSGQNDRRGVLLAKLFEGLPKLEPRKRIQTGARLVEQKQLGPMQ